MTLLWLSSPTKKAPTVHVVSRVMSDCIVALCSRTILSDPIQASHELVTCPDCLAAWVAVRICLEEPVPE